MKKIVVMLILIASILFMAINPWPAKLRVWNYTGDDVFIRLSYRGEQKYFLTATSVGNTSQYHLSLFDVTRKKYNAEVSACNVTATGYMDLNNNLKLTFVECEGMKRYDAPRFWGEPGMEKPNFYQHWDTFKVLYEFCGGWCQEDLRKLGWEQWKFQYDLPSSYETEVMFYVAKDEF